MNRMYDMDFLRSVAMFLGILLHGTGFLLPADVWPVHVQPYVDNRSLRENPYSYVFSMIHGFRIPLFFVLSGFFSTMLLRKRGLKYLAMHRVRRVGLPFLAATVTIIPVTSWLFLGDAFNPASWTIAWISHTWHVWFLWYLLWLTAGFVVLSRCGLTFSHPLWWLVIPVSFVPQYLMRQPVFGPDSADALLPDPVILSFYAIFFVLGAMLYSRWVTPRPLWTIALLPAILLFFPVGMLFMDTGDSGLSEPWIRSVSATCQAGFAWSMCFGMMGLFRWIASGARAWVQYMSDSAYWIYLSHLPLVVLLQMLLVDWAFNPHLKYLTVCLVTPAVLLLVYHVAIRYTAVGTMLNGKRIRLQSPGGRVRTSG